MVAARGAGAGETCRRPWRRDWLRRRRVRRRRQDLLRGQGDHEGPSMALQRELPAFGGLDRVGRAEDAMLGISAAPPDARPAGASGRLRQGRSSRASSHRSPACP